MEKYKKARLYDAGGDLNKQWFVYYYYLHPESRKFVRFKTTVSSRLKTKVARYNKASDIIKEFNHKLFCGWNPFENQQNEHKTLIDTIKYLVNIKQKTTGHRNARDYRNKSDDFIKWLKCKKMENIKPDEFNSRLAHLYLDSLLQRNISNRYYNNYLAVMRTIFNIMIEREYISANPFYKVKKLKPKKADICPYSQQEIDVINNTLPSYNYKLYAIVNIIFYCFIRPQELVRLKISSINLERQVIVIPASASKNGQQQTIIIPTPLKEILINLNLNSYPPHYNIFSSYLLPGTKEISPSRISDHWRSYRKKVGITKCIYDFKHTGAGLCIQAGINARDLQLQLRHHSLEVTQIYLDKFNNLASDRLKDCFPKFKP